MTRLWIPAGIVLAIAFVAGVAVAQMGDRLPRPAR